MAEAEKFNIDGTLYDISDPTARAAASNAQATANGKLSDAPSDGKQYARKNGGWSEVESVPDGGTIGQVLAKNSDTDGDAGWYNLRHLPSDKWYLPDGILESDVIAAYQFVNRLDEASALNPVNDNNIYPLSNAGSMPWSPSKGFYLNKQYNSANNKIHNNDLYNLAENMGCVAYGYSGFDFSYNASTPGFFVRSDRCLSPGVIDTGNGIFINRKSSASKYNKGVLSGNFINTQLFYNGINQSLSGSYSPWGSMANGILCTHSSDQGIRPFYVTCLVIYNIELTAAQHSQLANNIHDLGGID